MSSYPLSSHDIIQMAHAIRFLSMDAVEKAQSGHPGLPMGMADVVSVLFTKFLKFNALHPTWPDRDRFILSAGHGSMLLYSLLYLNGYKDMTLNDLKSFRQLGSKTAGHPEYGYAAGIETTTGPLGQGLGNAVGMALAEEMLRSTYGPELCNHRTYVLVGDGCLMEGISEEAISFAGHLNLSKLTVLFDDNHISIDGSTDLSTSTDMLKRFEASNWFVQHINGHDPLEIESALQRVQTSSQPSLIACRTKIAYGAPTKEGTSKAHGSPLGETEIQKTRDNLQWPYAPFEIPDSILNLWRANGVRSQDIYDTWTERTKDTSSHSKAFMEHLNLTFPVQWEETLSPVVQTFLKDRPSLATRQCSQKILDVLVPELPELIGGSADLTESNNTKAKECSEISPNSFKGHYIHYGIREHAMGAIMNGLALHGGFIPYGGTFLVLI